MIDYNIKVGDIDIICINKYIRPRYDIPFPCKKCDEEIRKYCEEYYPIIVRYTIEDKMDGLI
jgi:hypothetical protein